MTETEAPPADRRAAADSLILEAGDRLTRTEFERRYSARPQLKKAELIEGVVYVPSPVRYDGHGLAHAALLGALQGDAAAALATAQAGVGSRAHRAFAARVGGG